MAPNAPLPPWSKRHVGILLTLCALIVGCDSIGERYTAGTLVIRLNEESEAHDPVANTEVRLFEGPDSVGDHGAGIPYRTDDRGRVEHDWIWLGGGGEYSVRLVLSDTAYIAVDTTATFAVRGTKEDNFLEWQILVQRRGRAGGD
jgi:hypothetical protein